MNSEPDTDAVAGDEAGDAADFRRELPSNGHPHGPSAAEARPNSDVGESNDAISLCAGCHSPRQAQAIFCAECGFLFPDIAASETGSTGAVCPQVGVIIGGRYEIGELIGQRGPVVRFSGRDFGNGQTTPLPIVIVRQARPVEPLPEAADLFDLPLGDTADGAPIGPSGSLPDSGELSGTAVTAIDSVPVWPSLTWERMLLARTTHLSLPRVLDTFVVDEFEYLVMEAPEGRSFWDAWDETPVSWPRRCEWLIQIAEALEQLHQCGAMIEGLRPEIIRLSPTNQAVVADLTDLLPVCVPAETSVRGSYYSAPELVLAADQADARADLYSFGAMLHALLLGRELTDLDFSLQGVPRPYLERFPDGHPLLGRLLGRTFCRDVKARFPSRDLAEVDPTGFQELIEVLQACKMALGAIHLDVAAWTNTGMVRSANEDAVAVMCSSESRLEVNDDFALLILADGMGGMASGEVAAAMAVESVRDYFLRHPPFSELLLDRTQTDPPLGARLQPDLGSEKYRQSILDSLCEANRAVFEAAGKDEGHVGMGCTAEVVVVDGRRVEIGHVGDSRTYHLRQGVLKQVTQDQTLVSRLVALGQLTEEEAESHPQRSELQQAVGGRKDVYPDVHSLEMEPGDWLLVCSDGLTNQLKNHAIAETIRTAGSAEKAARRLVNQAILAGAMDNVSVIVVRAC